MTDLSITNVSGINQDGTSNAINLSVAVNTGNALRYVMNEQLIYDNNLKKVRALPGPKGDPWAFTYKEETRENTGLSVDHLEMIQSENSAESVFENCRVYYTAAVGATWFLKRSFLKLPIQLVLDIGLKIALTPLIDDKGRERPYHCDIWPTDGHDDFIDNQHAIITSAYELEIDNRNIGLPPNNPSK